VTKMRHRSADRWLGGAVALTVMDNTFAGFHQHGEYEVDLFLHISPVCFRGRRMWMVVP